MRRRAPARLRLHVPRNFAQGLALHVFLAGKDAVGLREEDEASLVALFLGGVHAEPRELHRDPSCPPRREAGRESGFVRAFREQSRASRPDASSRGRRALGYRAGRADAPSRQRPRRGDAPAPPVALFGRGRASRRAPRRTEPSRRGTPRARFWRAGSRRRRRRSWPASGRSRTGRSTRTSSRGAFGRRWR